ncbi:MAG TPA: LytTR family DNA-binding domain-containing protein [Thermoanaerobaculia bacterium]
MIADDEAPARRKIARHLARHPEAEIVAEASDGVEAVKAVRETKPDLVFLDIQMPKMTGFEVIAQIGAAKMPPVIFVTAYDEFALEAFEVAAVDYLLKPFNEARFEKAWSRATRERSSLETLLARVGRKHLERFTVREGERIFFVPLREVIRLSASGNYVELHTVNGAHLIRETLSALEERLDPERFVRIHRSDIVNRDFIKELQPLFHGDYVVKLKNAEKLRLSRRYQDRLL